MMGIKTLGIGGAGVAVGVGVIVGVAVGVEVGVTSIPET